LKAARFSDFINDMQNMFQVVTLGVERCASNTVVPGMSSYAFGLPSA